MAHRRSEKICLIRDVGEDLLKLIHGPSIAPNLLLRGPALGEMTYEQLGCPRTIINLRVETDDISHLPEPRPIHLHCPMANKSNVYDTHTSDVRTWLANIFRRFETDVELPILVHCKAGRDRTGVVVAVLLLILGVPKEAIMEEFLEAGGENARRSDLQRSFDGIVNRGGVDKYFEGLIDLDVVRRLFIADFSADNSFLDLQNLCREHFREARRASRQKEESAIACQKLLEACESGLKLQPEDVGMHAGMGWALVQLGFHDDAKRAFTEGLRLAVSTNVRDEIMMMMRREMNALAQIEESGYG